MIEVLLQTPDAALVETHIFAPGETLHAQFLLDLEVANILRKWAARGAIDAVQGSVALADLLHFDLQRHPHDLLLPRIWELRNNVTAYDASYIALAEMSGAILLTRDRRLAAAPGHHARVTVV